MKWTRPSDADKSAKGLRFVIEHPFDVKQIAWHHKGNYFATVMPEGASQVVLVHALQKQTTQVYY